jgi:SAM-dependent methyltransferase
MNLKTKLIIKGIATFIPGLRKIPRKGSMGGSISPRYCYSVWLRHLIKIWEKHNKEIPHTIAEIGPGESLGTGLAALLSGVQQYYGFDAVRLVNTAVELPLFEDLVRLFKERTDIPGPNEFPLIKPFIESYKFPSYILSDAHLDESLHDDRINSIRNAMAGMNSDTGHGSPITYIAPNYDLRKIPAGVFDMIFSQTALEYVPDLSELYKQLYDILKPDGIMSHQIDLTSMGLSEKWDGHWGYSDIEWKLIQGKKRCMINRATHSVHVAYLRTAGFRIIDDVKRTSPPSFPKEQLAKSFRSLPEDDLCTTGMYILATK